MSYQSDNDIQIISEKELMENVRKNIESKYPIPKVKILKESEFFVLEKKYNRSYLNKKRRYNSKSQNDSKKYSNGNIFEKEKKLKLISIDEVKRRKKDLEIIRKIQELKNKKRKNNININYENEDINKGNKDLNKISYLNYSDQKNNEEINLNSLIKKINQSSEPINILNNILNNNKNKSLELIKYYISEVHNLLNSN